MKQLIKPLFIILAALSFGSCKKNQIIHYNEKPAVYFADFNVQDSMVYSFIGKSTTIDTLYLNIKLLGDEFSAGKKFKVQVDQSMTTAKEAVHYKKLEDYYTFPANTFDTKLPIIIYNTDESLKTQFVTLTLTIESTDEINVGYPTQKNAHIIITNQLVKPVYWDSFLAIYFGEYSKVKHQICIQLMGNDFPTTMNAALAAPYGVAYLMSYGRTAAKYFIDHIVKDENGNIIATWTPF